MAGVENEPPPAWLTRRGAVSAIFLQLNSVAERSTYDSIGRSITGYR
jgi:hypothetical protein